MATQTFTFKQYTWTSFDAANMASDAVNWDAYPMDWEALVTAAGMDPDDDEIGVGTLTEAWNGHPEGALIVSGLTTAGYPFAVSVEALA